jgi:hypothetical protein
MRVPMELLMGGGGGVEKIFQMQKIYKGNRLLQYSFYLEKNSPNSKKKLKKKFGE